MATDLCGYKLALVALFKIKINILLNFKLKNEASRAYLNKNKRIFKWRPLFPDRSDAGVRDNHKGTLPKNYRKHPQISRAFFPKIVATNQGCGLSEGKFEKGCFQCLVFHLRV